MIDNTQVSFDDEMLIVVDEENKVIDYKDKLSCHLGDGILHRAFSIFIFNSKQELLLQQRSDEKMLWPLYWSNSCCSHPRKGEELEQATIRRLREELGIHTDLTYLFTFQYHARFKEVGSESEICAVYIGKSDDEITVNAHEVADWKFVPIDELNADMEENPELYSPWFKMEWKRIREEFWGKVEGL